MRVLSRVLVLMFVMQIIACGGGGSTDDGATGGTPPPPGGGTQNSASPTIPGSFRSVVSGTQNTLTWAASTDDQTVISYKIYRNNYLIGSSATLTFTDNSMLKGVTYYYRVSAVDNENNESVKSISLSGTAFLENQNVENCNGRRCFFVASTGVDNAASNDGSINSPFKTINFALAQTTAGDTVYVRAGQYRLPPSVGGEGTIRFPVAGTVSKQITLAGYPGETVRLIGSVQLATWTSVNADVWSSPAPTIDIKGLFDNGARIVHPLLFVNGVRSHPPLSQLKAGEWTIEGGLVYYWPSTAINPNNRTIEAAQTRGITINQQFVVVQNLTIEYTQSNGEGGGGVHIAADYAHVRNVRVGKTSKGNENSYALYFSNCSNSVVSNSEIYDSIYWGGYPNSHVISLIASGDNGPIIIENNNIHNNDNGLGVGSKGANRKIIVRDNYIHNVTTGINIPGARNAGPGAGRGDRGYYDIYRNVFEKTREGVKLSDTTNGNIIYNNVFTDNTVGVRHNWTTTNTVIANNVFLRNSTAVLLVNKLYDNGQAVNRTEMFPVFKALGLLSFNNNFSANTRDWGNQINDSANPAIVAKSYLEINTYLDLAWEQSSLGIQPVWVGGSNYIPVPGSPLINAGANLGLPFNGAAQDIGIVETP